MPNRQLVERLGRQRAAHPQLAVVLAELTVNVRRLDDLDVAVAVRVPGAESPHGAGV